jgi:hypothetical protein
MAFDVFISYSSKDKTTADAACAALESAGVRCWIAPRDVLAGSQYAEGIIGGIDSCRIMVLIFSSNANASPQIQRELERAVSRGLTIVPFRIEEIVPTKAMEYYLSSIHWLDALTRPLAKHLERLVAQVKANLHVEAANGAPPRGAFEQIAALNAPIGASRDAKRRWSLRSVIGHSAQLTLFFVATVLGAGVLVAWYYLQQAPPVVITKSVAFGGSGGAAFDDNDSNPKHLPISAIRVIVNHNPGDTTQRIIGGLQLKWGDSIGPLHGGKGPMAEPEMVVNFQKDEKIGRVDVNWMSYHFPENPPPRWIAGLAIWTDSRVYKFGDMTFGPTSKCVLNAGETLLGFFGRSGSYIDQIGCTVAKAK